MGRLWRIMHQVPIQNLKTGVISHPREGDIILNDAYEALGSHYMTAIMPTPVRRPKAYLQNQIIFNPMHSPMVLAVVTA
jgi:hypothetical protein